MTAFSQDVLRLAYLIVSRPFDEQESIVAEVESSARAEGDTELIELCGQLRAVLARARELHATRAGKTPDSDVSG